ncbi:MAG TPA: 50S ribosomal protein L29 [Terriglobia bacterium]|nr:50S ribosomal protein L29 [Terriglobia bacterium]
MKLEKDKKWKWPAENMREWTEDELDNSEREFSHQLLHLRFQLAGGQGDVLPVIRQLRKGIARVKTVRRQKALEAGAQAEA